METAEAGLRRLGWIFFFYPVISVALLNNTNNHIFVKAENKSHLHVIVMGQF